jgi:hypothetical protein
MTAKKPREHPLGPTLQPTIDRLKAIAAASADALLTEGPVHPDAALLDLCGEVLRLERLKEAAWQEERTAYGAVVLRHTKENDEKWRALSAERLSLTNKISSVLRGAKKLRATTPAGVYAKALMVRASQTGAAEFSMSLAADLIACEGLRQSLWPAEMVEAQP